MIIIHQIFSLMCDWSSYMHHMTEYSPAKTGEYLSDIPQFSKLHVLRKTFEE